MRGLFTRAFILNDTLKKLRMLIEHHQTDPENITRIRRSISESAANIIYLEETLSYLREALQDVLIPPLPRCRHLSMPITMPHHPHCLQTKILSLTLSGSLFLSLSMLAT